MRVKRIRHQETLPVPGTLFTTFAEKTLCFDFSVRPSFHPLNTHSSIPTPSFHQHVHPIYLSIACLKPGILYGVHHFPTNVIIKWIKGWRKPNLQISRMPGKEDWSVGCAPCERSKMSLHFTEQGTPWDESSLVEPGLWGATGEWGEPTKSQKTLSPSLITLVLLQSYPSHEVLVPSHGSKLRCAAGEEGQEFAEVLGWAVGSSKPSHWLSQFLRGSEVPR